MSARCRFHGSMVVRGYLVDCRCVASLAALGRRAILADLVRDIDVLLASGPVSR